MKKHIALLSSAIIISFGSLQAAEVEVIGTKRIQKSQINKHLNTENAADVIVKELYGTKLFKSIKLQETKGKIKVFVQENPLIAAVTIKGSKKIPHDQLRKGFVTKKGGFFNKEDLSLDIDMLQNAFDYAGYLNAVIKVEIKELRNNRVHVVYDISDGPKTLIKNINFVGNNKYTASELRSVIYSKEKTLLNIFENNDIYSPERALYDKKALSKFYHSVGYADFKVQSLASEVSTNKRFIDMNIFIYEGQKYSLNNIDIKTKLNIDVSFLNKYITSKKQDIYNMTKLEKQASEMTKALSDKMNGTLVVRPRIDKDSYNKVVNVTFSVLQGPKEVIRNINIIGNIKTRDNVIRRELAFAPGDLYTNESYEKSMYNLYGLDYFAYVDIEKEDVAKSLSDLRVKVEDKSTASISFSLGYDTSKGPFGQFGVHERNFLGKGQMADFMVSKYKRSLNFNLSVVNPNFYNSASLGGSVYRRTSNAEESNYDTSSYGFKIFSSYPLYTDLDQEVYFSWDKEKLTATEDSQSKLVKEQEGRFTTAAVGTTISYTKLDSKYIPKNGYKLSVTPEYAGFGGKISYLKCEADAVFYKSFFDNSITLKTTVEGGIITGIAGKKVRINDRFNLGDHNLRGFDGQGVGPRVKNTEEALGGNKFYRVSSELSKMISKDFNLIGHFFVDSGAVWDFDTISCKKDEAYNSASPAASVGVGISWMNKVAPIRFDYAIPVVKQKYDQVRRIHFKVATHF